MIRKLVMIRHGATDWTGMNKLQGQLNCDLSEAGRRQVDALKRLLVNINTSHVISSDLNRCIQTAEILGLSLDAETPCWREIDAGDWSGRLIEPLQDALNDWQQGNLVPPNGESRRDFSDRIGNALAGLSAIEAHTAVLFTHGQVIREMVHQVSGMPLEGLSLPELASATVLDLDQKRLLVYSAVPDLSHLDLGAGLSVGRV
ncbi:MAG: histidine phosphatase family protein [Desulfobacterales bacterium]|nr:histidine phosphatase family protein [Desulfobacterales bacterium]